MQHLTRRADESLMIGDGVEIPVIQVDGDTLRFATRAPRYSGVHESEVYVRLERSKHLGVVKAGESA